MKAHLIDTHLLLPRSSAMVTVKYQGHISQKWQCQGHLCFPNTFWSFLAISTPLTFARKVFSDLKIKLCQYWCERARKLIYRCTDCHDMTEGDKVALNGNRDLKIVGRHFSYG